MKAASKICFSLIIILIVFTRCRQNQPNEKFSFDKIYYYAIQEDVLKIVEALQAIPDDSLSADHKVIKQKYIARFLTRSEKFDFKTQDSLIGNTLTIFHNYWWEVLMKRHAIRESEDKYGILLSNLINSHSKATEWNHVKTADAKDIPFQLSTLLRHHGYYSRIERTGNIMDLIIWNNQTKENYAINIGDTLVNVHVVFIDNTITLGWEGFATFDHFYPGGWTGSDTLYCIKKDYTIESEHFRINYLTHETQHLLDNKFHPKVSGWMAEYRAKLAELSAANHTVYNTIDAFIKGSRDDSRLTHPYAEFRVIGDLSKEIFREKFVTDTLKWNKIPYFEINKVSVKLLKQNTIGLIGRSRNLTM
jgi:hypothetical protein